MENEKSDQFNVFLFQVIVLKKSEGLNAAPSSTSSVEVEELKKENQYLHEKNEVCLRDKGMRTGPSFYLYLYS